MYRTGDLARVNRSGVFEYLGRDDDQVKIRGARIELSAVAAALSSHPSIQDSVVVPLQLSYKNETHCLRCGLSSQFPGTTFNAEGICDQCESFELYHENALAYFRTETDLVEVFQSRQRQEGVLRLFGLAERRERQHVHVESFE